MADLLYAGKDPNTGKERYLNSATNMYTLSDEAPSQAVLDSTNSKLTFDKQDPSSGLFIYKNNDTGKNVYAPEKIPTSTIPPRVAEDSTTPSQIRGELNEIPLPGGGVAKVLTVQSDDLFAKLPNASNIAIPSDPQKAAELARSLGGMGATNLALPQSGAKQLVKPNFTTDDFKLKLTSKQSGDTVVFHVSPVIDESRSANYEHVAPVHHPGTIQVYKNSESRQFNISGKFISRTAAEASQNIEFLNWIRGWVMPYYGQGTAGSSESNRLGGPPDILVLDVYGDKNITNVPVVLTSYHWVYPDNVDYIPSAEGIPFPVIMDVSLSVIESYSPEQFSNFDLTAYRSGDMSAAYAFASTPTGSIVLPDADALSDGQADYEALIDKITDGDW
jgi:hypothetical protein